MSGIIRTETKSGIITERDCTETLDKINSLIEEAGNKVPAPSFISLVFDEIEPVSIIMTMEYYRRSGYTCKLIFASKNNLVKLPAVL